MFVDGAVILLGLEVFVLGRIIIQDLDLDARSGRVAAGWIVNADSAVSPCPHSILQRKVEVFILLIHGEEPAARSAGNNPSLEFPALRFALLYVPSGEALHDWFVEHLAAGADRKGANKDGQIGR